jgi:hypothetical protein
VYKEDNPDAALGIFVKMILANIFGGVTIFIFLVVKGYMHNTQIDITE